MADALFTINADSSNQGFDATASQVLTLRLKTLPVSGVSSVRFQVWDATAFDPKLDPLRNPPRKAKASPNLTLVGSTSGASVAPAAIDGTVSVTMPASTGHAWIVRCVVNGGMRTVGGRAVFEPTFVHERMIVIRDTDGNRPIIATETTQYEDDGWAPSVGKGEPGDDAPIGTGTASGFLSRRVYVNAASSRVGQSIWGLQMLAAVTFATAADLPPGNWFEVIVWGAGGSGANGRFRDQATNTNSIGGASGGGGGACHRAVFSRAELVAALPIVMTIAADSVPTANATVADTTHSGTNGGPTHFGTLLSAFGGAGGRQNNTGVSGGTGGGWAHQGVQSVSGANNLGGGAPAGSIPGYGGYGAASADGIGYRASGGGGAGGGPCSATGAGGAGGAADSGGGGGGGAGGATNAGTTGASATNGGDGGLARGSAPPTDQGGGGLGGVGAASAPTAGANGADAPSPASGGSGGGGGGSAAAGTTLGGAGGNGGFPGGGGGGGGAARGAAGTARGGLGGIGAGGCICLTAYR